MPLRTTSHPLDGRDAPACPGRDLFANKKIREDALGEPPAHWLGGRSPAPRLPPNQRAGGAHFSKFSPPAPFFLILFFNPFFKKTRGLEGIKKHLKKIFSHSGKVSKNLDVPRLACQKEKTRNNKFPGDPPKFINTSRPFIST
jgi:hypothetical protein